MMQYFKEFIISIFIIISNISLCYAEVSNDLVCLDATRKVEAEYNIPSHILSAIALTETGRTNTETKMRTPWPWTANIGGQGRYFKTRHEALITFKQLIAKKYHMFDVGCMQINWHYHKEAFGSIEEALNPYNNVRYAAEFLTSLYQETGSWVKAVEYYHSKTPQYYTNYRQQVALNWDKARDLMSPINGRLNNYFSNIAYLDLPKENKQSKLLREKKIARMREVAKMRAQIRQYAQNTY